MLVSILPVPFAEAARQQQFEAVRAALAADANAPPTVLLGNLPAFTGLALDALVVRPQSLALLVLTPRAGRLSIPALAYGGWQLDGQPLPGRAGADNPFAQYQHQLPRVRAWLSEELGVPEAELPPAVGFALFEVPLTFGPGVEAQLHHHAATHDFQLVGGAAQLPGRLSQYQATEVAGLPVEDLLEWGEYLAGEPYVSHTDGIPDTLLTLLAQKLRQLWQWLGAEDIPADPPYGGGPTPDTALRDQQERARLQQLRQELQAELHQQRQEAAAREAARTQELAQLRQQLAQAGPAATERRAEQQAKATLEESLGTARAELATRNQELDARIRQLGQLIGRLQANAAGPAIAAGAARPAAAPARAGHQLRRAERWGLVALVAAGVGVGTWGVVRLVHRPRPRPAISLTHRRREDDTHLEAAQPPNVVYVTDSTLAPSAQADTADAYLFSVDPEPVSAPTPAPARQPADSARETPAAAPDSAATPSPTP